MNKDATIKQARELRRSDQLEESQALLLELLSAHPHDPLVLFEVGGAYDVLGEGPEAIDHYQKALDHGLEGPDLQECLLCLGINQRALGQFDTAVTTLEKAHQQFPDSSAIRAFLALAYYSAGRDDDAVRHLLDLLITTSDDAEIQTYADTLDFYKENLDEVWEE